MHQIKLGRALDAWRREQSDQTKDQTALTTTLAAAAVVPAAAPAQLREFLELLEASNLPHLFKAFVDVGIDSVALLASLSPEEVSILGLKQGHAVKLKKALGEWRAANPTAVPPPAAETSPPPTSIPAASAAAVCTETAGALAQPGNGTSKSVCDADSESTAASTTAPHSSSFRSGVEESKSSAPVDEAAEALQQFMVQQSMPHMLINLTDNGITSVAQLAALENEALKAHGFKKAHLMKLKKPLQDWRDAESGNTKEVSLALSTSANAPASAAAAAAAAALPDQVVKPSVEGKSLNGDSATTAATTMSELERFLTDNGLQSLFETFTDAGVDTMVKLAPLEPSALSHLGLKKAHLMKLKKSLQEWRTKEGHSIESDNVSQVNGAATSMGAEIASSVNDVKSAEIAEFQYFLTENGLAHLFGKFTEAGIDSVFKLAALEPSSLATLGLKKAQKMKLDKALSAWRSSLEPAAANVSPAAPTGPMQSSQPSLPTLPLTSSSKIALNSNGSRLTSPSRTEAMAEDEMGSKCSQLDERSGNALAKLSSADPPEAMAPNQFMASAGASGVAESKTDSLTEVNSEASLPPPAQRGPTAESTEFSAFMNVNGLAHLSQAFIDAGLDSISKLTTLDTAGLKAIGLKKAQAMKLSKALQEWEQTNATDSEPMVGGAPACTVQDDDLDKQSANSVRTSRATNAELAELSVFLDSAESFEASDVLLKGGVNAVSKLAELSAADMTAMGIKKLQVARISKALKGYVRSGQGRSYSRDNSPHGHRRSTHGSRNRQRSPPQSALHTAKTTGAREREISSRIPPSDVGLLEMFLTQLKMQHFTGPFIASGLDSINKIAKLSQAELEELGIKRAHAQKLARALQHWQRATGGYGINSSNSIGSDVGAPKELRAFLMEAQLPHVLKTLTDAGHLTCAQIARLSPSELAGAGLKPAQIKKVTRAIAEWRNGHLGNLGDDEYSSNGSISGNRREASDLFRQPGSFFIYRRFSDFCKLQLALSQPIEDASLNWLERTSNKTDDTPPFGRDNSNSGNSSSSNNRDGREGVLLSIPEKRDNTAGGQTASRMALRGAPQPLVPTPWRPLEASVVEELFPLPSSGVSLKSAWRKGVTAEKCYERGRILEV